MLEGENLFELRESSPRILGLIDDRNAVMLEVDFEMSKDKVSVQRNIYTALDLLSDIGGI